MSDKNVVELQGSVYGNVYHGKTVHGRAYASFPLSVEPSPHGGACRARQTIHVLVFDEKALSLLRERGVHEGSRLHLDAFLTTHITQRRGVTFLHNNVVAYKLEFINYQEENEDGRLQEGH